MSAGPERRIPPIIGNYALGRLLGSGYSGSIYEARHIHHGHIVALKLQDVDHECMTNKYERYLYPFLRGGKGMPNLYAYGEQDGWDYLAMDLLGSSLHSLHKSVGGPEKPLDIGTVCTIAIQMIERLETMHRRGVLHRDIQLGNTVIGRVPDERTLYMIDFGFSKCYIDPRTRRHIPDSNAKRDFIGNYWFSSVGVHCRVPSRRDDMEAAALMFIHMLTPRGLSWTRKGVPKTDADHDILKGQKRRARPEDLCRGLPAEFEEFLRYCRSLKFYEQPDYYRWMKEFRELKVDLGYGESDEFIWPPPAPTRQQSDAPPPPYTSRVIHPPAYNADEMEGIINGLRAVDFNGPDTRQILGDRTNVEETVRRARNDDTPGTEDAIEISDSSEDGESKASRLIKLTAKASHATDNAGLSALVRQFILALKCNSSRQLTKDASAFLDALYKQLADPSVFVAQTRTSRPRSDLQREEREPAHVKLGVVARLKAQIGTVISNKDIAIMVAEFTKVTNKSSGRTITKVPGDCTV
ncbi:hypothetical protein H0H87_004642 [Tephrocybe sp. NHM501043]|nr:hypothetical protein H0H87_004642 [Tephrocybe sp. NHM501043]